MFGAGIGLRNAGELRLAEETVGQAEQVLDDRLGCGVIDEIHAFVGIVPEVVERPGLARLLLLMYDPAKDVSEELVQIRHTIYHRPAFVAAIDRLLALQELENRQPDLLTEQQLSRSKAPTLVVWGAENPFGEVPEAHRIQQAIAGSRLEIFPRCGHWPQNEHSDRFNALNLAHLSGES